MSENATVLVTELFATPPARVYDAWFAAEDIRYWLFGSSDVVVESTIDPKVGGSFSFLVLRDGQRIEHRGEYKILDRPHQLSFTWEVPKFSNHSSVVSISLTAIGTGTKLTLTHRNVLAEYEKATEK